MKPVTSKAEGKKKKQREEPPASPPESAKKGKVHAQRKFAQGSGCSNYASVSVLPPRDQKKPQTRNAVVPKAPLITNRVPTTSQFLDFLCYGGSKLLPSSLHYLRDASLATSSSSPPAPANTPPPPMVKKEAKTIEEKPKAVVQMKVESKVPDALRKKYHDQRVAKQKQTSVTKLAQKVKGKVMVRTRSAVGRDDMSKPVEAAMTAKVKKKPVIALRKQLQRGRKPPVGRMQRQRAGLRSGGKIREPSGTVKDVVSKPKKAEPDVPKITKEVAVPKKVKSKAVVSSDDEPLLTKKPRVGKEKPSLLRRTRSKVMELEEVQSKTNTEAKTFRPKRSSTVTTNKEPVSIESSPERSKKEEPEKKRVVKPVKEKVTKAESNKEAAMSRRATRSTPVVEAVPKKAIRDLIQKKKQQSLNTLKRLKKPPVKPSAVEVKKREVKTNFSASASEDKNAGKSTSSDATEKEDVPSPARALRRKTVDAPESKGKVPTPIKAEKSLKTKKAEKAAAPVKTKVDDDKTENSRVKRPVRKCSTHDKMWIDVDGFTSDEDDFIDMGSIVAGSLSAISSDISKKDNEEENELNSRIDKKEKNDITSNIEKKEKNDITNKVDKKEKNDIINKVDKKEKKDITNNIDKKETNDMTKNIDKKEKNDIINNIDKKGKNDIINKIDKEGLLKISSTKTSIVKTGDGAEASTSETKPMLVEQKPVASTSKSDQGKDNPKTSTVLPKTEVIKIAEKQKIVEEGSKISVEAKSPVIVPEKLKLAEVENQTNKLEPVQKIETPEVKKETLPRTRPLMTSMMNPVLFPKTAAWLKMHESKDSERNLEMEEVGVRPVSAINSPSSNNVASGSHSLISRIASNNVAMTKPSVKVEPKIVGKDLKPPVLNEGRKRDKSAFVAEVKPTPTDSNRKTTSLPLSERLEKRFSGNSSFKKFNESEKRKILLDSSEDSDSSAERAARRKKTRRPSPRAEVVTRKERPKRQCSTMGKSWIERDSDDSTFYGDDEDVMELIRRSEKDLKRRENRKAQQDGSSMGNTDNKRSDVFSDSDDEPLLKKTMFAPSPSSFLTTDTPFSKSRCDSVPRESLSPAVLVSAAAMPAPTVTFRTLPREPINTAGLDLLSEVADKSTDRIEQWLKQSIREEGGEGFFGFDANEVRRPPPSVPNASIPDPVLQFVRSPPKPSLPDTTAKKIISKVETVPKRPPVSSVSDLIKLQRERKGSPKPVQEHTKNCKCNSCVVKKGWFKNKPSPEEPKPVTKESPEKEVAANRDVSTEQSSAKASVSVAPMVQIAEVSASTDTKITSPRKSFLERMQERERREALVKMQLPPFSPSNESSVYAFEPEPSRVASNKAATQRTLGTTTSSTPKPTQSTSPSQTQSHQSTSIAVQVNMDTGTDTVEPVVQDDGRSFEISTQTEGGDEDPSPMFYIPLQTGSTVTSQQAVIQGVTLKLGTEGPAGPNQTLVMQAKLVTKPPSPAPTRKAVVMPQKKEAKMTPPVGTVQPTTRKPPASSPRPRASVSPSSSKSSQSGAKKRGSTPLRGKSPLSSRSAKVSPATSAAKSASPVIMEAPTFHLTEKDFSDPLEFFDRIRPAAERFGLCRIVPPSSFKPDCKVADDMRFTAYNQYVHRMFHRWGPSARETMAMKKYLKTQSITLKPLPCVGGVEVDLPRLYQAVQTCGGLMKVIEKQKWQQVADLLRLPKAAHDRVTKLDSIYCKFLLPYETLSEEERNKLLNEVDAEWAAHEEKIGKESQAEDEEDEEENDVEECEECIVKGRSMALNQFYRIARNTMSMWFKSGEPDAKEVEAEFWRLVTERKHHVCVHSGSIDSSGGGYGFPVGKNQFAKHPWNLKVLTNNSGSVLRSLGPVMGVTVPTLTVGMVFAAFCWYRDPHGLPWVEYLHTGAPKIWYGISDSNSTLFRETLTKMMPKFIKEQRIWLPCDTAMVPPQRLAELGIPLSSTTQNPGEFVLVFPKAFTSSLCTGYLVSELVYFARPSWLQTAEDAFREIHASAEPTMFSLDNLLLSIATDNRASLELLKLVLPMVQRVRDSELTGRAAIRALGVVEEPLPKEKNRRKGGRSQDPEPEHECETCRRTLFLSMVSVSAEEAVFCLQHGLEHLKAHQDHLSGSKLLYIQQQVEIDEVVEKLEERISAKECKTKKPA